MSRQIWTLEFRFAPKTAIPKWFAFDDQHYANYYTNTNGYSDAYQHTYSDPHAHQHAHSDADFYAYTDTYSDARSHINSVSNCYPSTAHPSILGPSRSFRGHRSCEGHPSIHRHMCATCALQGRLSKIYPVEITLLIPSTFSTDLRIQRGFTGQ